MTGRPVMIGGFLVGLAEGAALLRTVTGRGRVETTVPARSDGLDRALTVIQRLRVPDRLLDTVHAFEQVPSSAVQAAESVHLTVLDLTDLVPLGSPATRQAAADGLGRRLADLAIPMPSAVRLGRIGATDASVFVTVEDPAAADARHQVAAGLGRRLSLRDRVHVVNLARYDEPPSAGALMRLPRSRLRESCELGPPQLVWTDKFLSASHTTVVRELLM